MNVVYFETNHINGSISILTHMKVKINKILFLIQGIELPLFFLWHLKVFQIRIFLLNLL